MDCIRYTLPCVQAEESRRTTKELKDTNTFNQITPLQYSVFSRDYEQQTEEELLKCIAIGEGKVCYCTICLVKLTNSVSNFRRHINGRKHKKNTQLLIKSMNQKTELQNTIIELSEKNSLANNSIEGLEQLMNDLKNEIKLCQNNVQQYSTSSKNKETQNGKDSLDRISMLKIANTSCNRNQHIDGKEHNQDLREVVGSTIYKLELQDIVSEVTKQIQLCRSIIEESKVEKNVHNMNKAQQDSASFSNREVQSEKELLDYVIFEENGSCTCRICKINIPKTSHNIAEHINGKQHVQNMVETMKPKLRNIIIELTASLEKWISMIDESKQMVKELSDINNSGQNNVPQFSALSLDKEMQTLKKFLDCVSLWENHSYVCKVCLTQVPNTTSNIDEHVNGKKHRKKLQECQISAENVQYLTEENSSNIISIVEDLHFCQICHKCLPRHSLVKEHIESKKHKKKDP